MKHCERQSQAKYILRLVLEEQVASLQARLEKANRKISINEIHTESYVNERDEALKNVDEQLEKIDSLQEELEVARRELVAARRAHYIHDGVDASAEEIHSLRDQNLALRKQYKASHDEAQSLRANNAALIQENAELQQEIHRLQRQLASVQGDQVQLQEEYEIIVQEKRTIRQDNLSLERQNDNLFTEHKSLQQKKSLLERQLQDLMENNAQLHDMLDAANEHTGAAASDIKDMKDRLGKQNRQLSDENALLQQQVIDLQANMAKKQTRELDNDRLTAKNEHLHEQLGIQLPLAFSCRFPEPETCMQRTGNYSHHYHLHSQFLQLVVQSQGTSR